MLKQFDQLKEGFCKVVTEYKGQQKEFNGKYSELSKVVFFIIPEHYNVLGYLQD